MTCIIEGALDDRLTGSIASESSGWIIRQDMLLCLADVLSFTTTHQSSRYSYIGSDIPRFLSLGIYSSSSDFVACEYSLVWFCLGLEGAADLARDNLGCGFSFGLGGAADCARGILICVCR